MPLWMLWIFALCMASAVLSFGPLPALADVAVPVFLASAAIFLIGLAVTGVRRPVV